MIREDAKEEVEPSGRRSDPFPEVTMIYSPRSVIFRSPDPRSGNGLSKIEVSILAVGFLMNSNVVKSERVDMLLDTEILHEKLCPRLASS